MSLLHDLPTRLVARMFQGVIAKGPAGGVYLTFDDGPDQMMTPQFLKALSDLNCPATFFLTGSKVSANSALVRQIVDSGHTIGSHSFNHTSLLRANCNRLRLEITSSLNAIEATSGIRPTHFRPPYGRIWRKGCKVARELGLTTVLWSLSANDWQAPSPSTTASRIVDHVADGDIILLHDSGKGAEATLKALPMIVSGIRTKGFAFATLLGGRQ